MKTKYLSCLVVTFALNAQSAFAGHLNGGGGGVKRNGKFLTFSQAGYTIPNTKPVEPGVVQVKVTEIEDTESVPLLPELLKQVNSMDLDAIYKGKMRSALAVDEERKYYWVDKIPDPLKQELIKNYIRALGEDESLAKDVAVYGFTKGTETFFFEDFKNLYQSYQNEKDPKVRAENAITLQSVLMHEARWILAPNLTYAENMKQDQAFEEYLRTGFSIKFYRQLATFFGDPWVSIQAAQAREIQLYKDGYPAKAVYEVLNQQRQVLIWTSYSYQHLLGLSSWTISNFDKTLASHYKEDAIDRRGYPHFHYTYLYKISKSQNGALFDQLMQNVSEASEQSQRTFAVEDYSAGKLLTAQRYSQPTYVAVGGKIMTRTSKYSESYSEIANTVGFQRDVPRLVYKEFLYYKNRLLINIVDVDSSTRYDPDVFTGFNDFRSLTYSDLRTNSYTNSYMKINAQIWKDLMAGCGFNKVFTTLLTDLPEENIVICLK